MEYCVYCGNEILNNEEFCPECGERVLLRHPRAKKEENILTDLSFDINDTEQDLYSEETEAPDIVDNTPSLNVYDESFRALFREEELEKEQLRKELEKEQLELDIELSEDDIIEEIEDVEIAEVTEEASVIEDITEEKSADTQSGLSAINCALSLFAMSIPILGTLLALIWAFGGTSNKYRKNLATGFVGYLICLTVAFAIGYFLLDFFNHSFVVSLKEALSNL